MGDSELSFVGGGSDHLILEGSKYAFIGAGSDHTITETSRRSGIVVGQGNLISGSVNAAIIAGEDNTISGASEHSIIGAGRGNTISNESDLSIIGAGRNNVISSSYSSSILAGGSNLIQGYGNVHIIGSNITAGQSDTTYTENIIASGSISASGDLFGSTIWSDNYLGKTAGSKIQISGVGSLLSDPTAEVTIKGNTLVQPTTGEFTVEGDISASEGIYLRKDASSGGPAIEVRNNYPDAGVGYANSLFFYSGSNYGGMLYRALQSTGYKQSLGLYNSLINGKINFEFSTELPMQVSASGVMIAPGKNSSTLPTNIPKELTVVGSISASSRIHGETGEFAGASIGKVVTNTRDKGIFTVNYGTSAQMTGSLSSVGNAYGDVIGSIATSSAPIAGPGALLRMNSDGIWSACNCLGSVNTSLLGIYVGPDYNVLLRGFAKIWPFSGSAASLNSGERVYVSKTLGSGSVDVPDSSGDIVRIIGYTINGASGSNDPPIVYFNPDNTWVEIA